VDLEKKVAEGAFRKDLYYRINVFTLRLPPLRERKSDISLLVDRLSKKLARRLDIPVSSFSPEAMTELENYDWPGNVRQLENVIERIMLHAHGNPVTLDILDKAMPQRIVAKYSVGKLANIERQTIEDALKKTGGNISAAAKIVGIARKTVYAKLKLYGIAADDNSYPN
jgi:DNA-binding NtrC family response regulator